MHIYGTPLIIQRPNIFIIKSIVCYKTTEKDNERLDFTNKVLVWDLTYPAIKVNAEVNASIL